MCTAFLLLPRHEPFGSRTRDSEARELTFASSCARPAIRDETMSGSISIFSIRIKISPGNEINMIVSSLNSEKRSRKPMIKPSTTPAIVRTSRAFSLSQAENWVPAGAKRQQRKERRKEKVRIAVGAKFDGWAGVRLTR